VPAIGAVRRKALRRESIFKKVRIGVGANPALVGDLEISLGNVGEQRGKLKRPQFKLDAHAAPLFLKGRANEAGLLFRRAFQREMRADSVLLARETRSVEYLFGASRIVRILRDIRFGGPVIRGQSAPSQLRLATEEIANERFAVGRQRKELGEFRDETRPHLRG